MIGCILKRSIRNMSQTAEGLIKEKYNSRGVQLSKVTAFLENFAPKSLSESWDNTGLLIEPTVPRPVESILLTNDLTEDVVSEAMDLNVGLIISYHPPIFAPLKEITTKSWKGRIIAACLENKIAVYSPHTSWDSVTGGINDWLVSAFDTEIVNPINPSKEQQKIGAGRYAKLKTGIKLSEAINKVKKLTCLNYLGLALAKGATLDTVINDVAVCAGSGASVLVKTKADLYLTGEMSHHSLLDAVHNGTSVILCNHSNSERGFLNEFSVTLKTEFGSDMDIFVSKKDKDPLQVV